MSLNLGYSVSSGSNEVTDDIDMKNFRITQSIPATDDNHLINKKYATEKFAKKENYRLSATMTWYYGSLGGDPISLNRNTFPMVPVSKNTMVRILCHSFDSDGPVPDDTVTVRYRISYTTLASTKITEVLGDLTLGKADQLFNNMWTIPVNHDFYVKDVISGKNAADGPTVGFINIIIGYLTSGNESCMTAAFYEPV